MNTAIIIPEEQMRSQSARPCQEGNPVLIDVEIDFGGGGVASSTFVKSGTPNQLGQHSRSPTFLPCNRTHNIMEFIYP